MSSGETDLWRTADTLNHNKHENMTDDSLTGAIWGSERKGKNWNSNTCFEVETSKDLEEDKDTASNSNLLKSLDSLSVF